MGSRTIGPPKGRLNEEGRRMSVRRTRPLPRTEQRAVESLQREVRLLAELQRHLLPREAPRVAGWDLRICGQLAGCPGGDYYDFLALPGGRVAFLVADASGHGLAAGVLTSQVRTLLHSCPL